MQKYIGIRLKEERERLGLSQVAMGDIGGVKKLTQLNYEKGDRFPDASYLAALSKFGLDVQYVVTGVRTLNNLSSDEQDLIDKFRSAPLAIKAAALGALTAGTAQQGATSKTKVVNISGNNNKGSVFGNVNTYHIGDNKK